MGLLWRGPALGRLSMSLLLCCSALAEVVAFEKDLAAVELDVLRPSLPLDLLRVHLEETNESSSSSSSSRSSCASPPSPEQSKLRVAEQQSPLAQRLAHFREENDWKNDLVIFWLPSTVRDQLPRVAQSWLRNYVAVIALYFGVGLVWSYYIYWCFGEKLFAPGAVPGWGDVVDQIKVAMSSMPLYAVLPAVTEAVVERGWTAAYARIEEVGTARYFAYFVAYMSCVEFFVYWMHRLLHDIRVGYRYLHHIHHLYNKEHTLSPFAGLAFHPLDGILQAIPYCFMLFFVPMHFLTHELLLFATGVWTANIHDNVDGRCEPIMGAAFHTIHHTTYKHNYGHYFIYVDQLFGTLQWPDLPSPSSASREAMTGKQLNEEESRQETVIDKQ